MKRPQTLLAAAGLSLSLAAAAFAAPPAVLDRIPDTAMFAVTLPAPEQAQKNLQALAKSIEFPFPLPEIKDLLASAGATDGVDPSKGMAIVVFPHTPKPGEPAKNAKPDHPEDDADGDGDGDGDAGKNEQDAVVLIPFTKYESLLAALNVPIQAENGPVAAKLPNGDTTYLVKANDAYAAMSPRKDLLESFMAAPSTGKLKAGMGTLGTSLSETHDLLIIANMGVLRPMIPALVAEMKEKAAERAASLGGAGAGVQNLDNPALTWMIDQFGKDAQGITAGLKTGTLGLSLDLAINFPKDSYSGALFAGPGTAGELFAKLPNTPYLLAGAIDVSSPAFKKFVGDVAEKAKAAGGPGSTFPSSLDSLKTGDGHAAVLGFNPATVIGGGIFTNTVSYSKAKDPAAHLASIRDELKAMDGFAVEGFKIASTYTENGAKVGETPVDVWETKMTMAPGRGSGGPNPMAMLFGPTGGPSGYLVKTDGGVYRTFAKNSDLLTSAFKAAKGENALGSDKVLQQVAEQMPKNRLAEAYVGTKSILDLVVPLTAMFGLQFEAGLIPDSLPPVGAAIAGSDGQAHFNVYIPAPVLKATVGIGIAMQSQLQGAGGEDPDAPDADADAPAKKPSGQPRF